MKQILSLAFALAVAGTLIGCDQAGRDSAGSGGTSGQSAGSGSSSPSSPGGTSPNQPKRGY